MKESVRKSGNSSQTAADSQLFVVTELAGK